MDPIYFHSSGDNFSVVVCKICNQRMHSVYDPDIRDTCSDCGGTSKVVEQREEMRAQLGLYPLRPKPRGQLKTLYGPDAGRPL